MVRFRIAVAAAAFALLPLAWAGAREAGGFTWGQEILDPALSNDALDSQVLGVYGYGVDYAGRRAGAFALAIHSTGDSPVVEGGFVGGIAGQELRRYPLLMAINLWAGLGGLSAGNGVPTGGSFAMFGEITAEIGLTAIPGVVITGYGGLQAMSAVSSSEPLFSRAMYCPILGIRVAWG